MKILLGAKAEFEKVFNDFWSLALRDLILIHHQFVEENDGTLFALARSESQWRGLRDRFERYLKIAG